MGPDTHDNQIEVKVVYPSAHQPAVGSFTPETLIRQIKQFALSEFGLQEQPVDGNQIVFFLFHERTKIENLDQPLSTFVQHGQHKVQFRLVKEVIAG
ncbi:MAG: hypothetical protein ACREIJ_00765 [Nitrospiraceae bacterium]